MIIEINKIINSYSYNRYLYNIGDLYTNNYILKYNYKIPIRIKLFINIAFEIIMDIKK